MKITHKISMDLDRYSVPGFDAVWGDRYTRELEIALYENGVPWEIPAETAVIVRYQKPDGTAGAYDLLPDGTAAWGIGGNTVTVTAAPQTMTAPGCVILTVCLANGDREISTFQILMNVRPAVGLAESVSGDYWYLSGSLPQPLDAAVGEVLVVDSVDSNGRVTGLKTVALNTAGASGMSASQVSALEALLKLAAYTGDPSGAWEAFQTAFHQEAVRIPATGITLSAVSLSFGDAASQQLSAALMPSDTTDVLAWTTSNPAVATVRDGLVTPVGNGSCTITASAGSVSAACAVAVEFPEETVTYAISYALTNVTCSESAAEIKAGDSFTADLIAGIGYVLDTVTVTMGGVDISADAVSVDFIAIGNVTGDIVITATAVPVPEEDTRTVLYRWDFTKSTADTVTGAEATLSGAAQDSSGVTIDAWDESMFLGNFWNTNRTIEVDFGSFVPNFNATNVLVMFGSSNGFSHWANGQTWGIYCNGAWDVPDPKNNEANYFANSTLKLKVAEDGTISVYRNEEWIMTSTQTFATADAPIHIGKVIGSTYGSVQPITVTGCRIYEGVE